jgi:hypothetical protein
MRILILLLTGLMLQFSLKAASALYVPVQFIIENGDYDGSMVVLKKNGVSVFSVPGDKNMRLKLNFNEAYILAFTKPGYITKQIAVDTNVPDERLKTGFDPYKIGVRLYKQYDGVNTVVYNQPVANIRFMASLDDFGYDTDYSKSILSLLTDTENKLAEKAEAEREKMKVSGKVNSAGILLFSGNTNEASQNNTARKARTKENTLQTENPPGFEPELTVIEPAENSPVELKNPAPHTTPPATGNDELISGKPALGEDYRSTSKGIEGKDQPAVNINSGSGADAQITTAPGEKSLVKTREQIFEPHRTITTIVIRKNGKSSVYHQVQYLNGECFYFMNGTTAISAHLFEYFTGENR